MAKNHKANCPMRPVLSAINTPEYYMAKWFESQLKPYVTDKYTVSSSTAFVEELRNIKPSPNDICVSFDICSLYTNVPLAEVIDNITNTVFGASGTSTIFNDNHKVTPTIFKNMLRLCSESVFLCKNGVYKQCDGVAMGSPLAPLLANWFVVSIENKILNDTKHESYKPKIYKRYVDDLFAVFKLTEDRDDFYKVLNSAHPNLRFTMETISKALPFLDVSVAIKDEAYSTKVYRKPTNTGVLMHFDCMAPLQWKKSLIKCFLNRALRLSSDVDSFNTEVDTIRASLLRNGYPSRVVNNVCDAFITENKIDKESFNKDHQVQSRQRVRNQNEVYVCIPYVGRPSTKLQHKIRKEMQSLGVTTMAAFKTTKVGSYFSLKPPCPHLFQSNVVYQFSCFRDGNSTYIGETRRQLFQRVDDHRGKDKKSAVFDHVYNCNPCQSVPNISSQFRILKKCDGRSILSCEALLIARYRPVLNVQLGPARGRMVSLSLYN